MEEMEDGGCGRVRLLGVRVCRTSASMFAIVPAPGRNAISFPPADMRIMSSARKLSRTNSSCAKSSPLNLSDNVDSSTAQFKQKEPFPLARSVAASNSVLRSTKCLLTQ